MNPFTLPLQLQPGSSRILSLVITMVFLFLVIMLLIIQLNTLFLFTGLLILLSSYVHILREHALRKNAYITTAQLMPDGRWRIELQNGDWLYAELKPGCLVLPWLTVLVFRYTQERSFMEIFQSSLLLKHSLILVKDNVDAEIFRRCRARLIHAES